MIYWTCTSHPHRGYLPWQHTMTEMLKVRGRHETLWLSTSPRHLHLHHHLWTRNLGMCSLWHLHGRLCAWQIFGPGDRLTSHHPGLSRVTLLPPSISGGLGGVHALVIWMTSESHVGWVSQWSVVLSSWVALHWQVVVKDQAYVNADLLSINVT